MTLEKSIFRVFVVGVETQVFFLSVINPGFAHGVERRLFHHGAGFYGLEDFKFFSPQTFNASESCFGHQVSADTFSNFRSLLSLE